ncbi:MAG: hypothetical protein AAFN11_00515, partial [Chloroflexota bacterium]
MTDAASVIANTTEKAITVVVFAMTDADLSVSVISDSTVVPINTNFTYSITVENLGPDAATFVSVTDNLPSELIFLTSDDGCTVAGSTVTCDIGDIPFGDSATVTYQARAIAAGLPLNSVSVIGAETDANLTNNSAGVSVEVVIPEEVDITLSGAVSPVSVDMSDLIDVNFTVANNDVAAAYLTVVDFVLPAQLEFDSSSDCSNSGSVVTCSVGTVDSGSPVSVAVVVRAIAPGNPVSISALVSHFENDPDSSNNGSSVSLVVNEPPPDSADLQFGMAPAGTEFVVGQSLDVTFTVINAGPSNATGVRIINDLPDQLEFVSSTECALAGDLLVCDIGDLALNAVYTATVSLRGISALSAVTNNVSVVANEVDPNIINNVASIVLPIVDPALPTPSPTITDTPTATGTPIVVTATPGPTQTPFQVIVTQPVFLTEVPASDGSSDGSGSTEETTGAGGTGGTGGTGGGTDPLPDGVSPADLYGWNRFESVDVIQVTGRWSLRTMQNASDGAYHETRDSGATLRFPFEGDGFRIGFRSQVNGASFQILLNGEFLSVYDTNFEVIDPELDPIRQTFVTRPHWVTPGYNVIDIVCLADGQGSEGCNIDYVEVFTGPPIPVAPTVVVVPTEAIVVQQVELVSAPPTVAPTGTPQADSVITVDVFVNVDLNTNSQVEPNEGVSGITVRAVDVASNTLLATSVTDDSGFVRISVSTGSDVVLLIPVLGDSFYVRNRGEDVSETWQLILDPANVPGLIP